MITKVYTIHDSAVKAFVTPHFARSHGEAERNFRAAVNDEKNGHLYNSPENFTLFHIGEYDDETGIISSRAPESILSGVQVKQSLSDSERQLRMAGT